MSSLEELCTVKQACFTEKCGRTTLYKRIAEGHYIAVKIGGSTRLVVASLKAYRRTFGSNTPSSISTLVAEPVQDSGHKTLVPHSVSTDLGATHVE